jgi:hypothetical protein
MMVTDLMMTAMQDALPAKGGEAAQITAKPQSK